MLHVRQPVENLISTRMALAKPAATIADLPDEILLKIFMYLTTKKKLELLVCSKPVCRHWYRVAQDPFLWRVIDYCKFGNIFRTQMPLLVEVVRKASKLKVLSLGMFKGVSDILRAAAFHCPELQVLKFDHSFGSDSLGTVLRFIAKRCTNLREICIASMWEDGPLFTCLSHFKNLRKVTLRDFRCLKQGIAHNHHQLVEDIDLFRVMNVSDDDLKIIIESQHTRLTRLVISGNSLSDATFCALPKCSKLKSLTIYNAICMTDVGLLQGVAIMNELLCLHLTRAWQLTSNALAFAKWPEQLLELDLSQCPAVNDCCLENIAKRCPLLQILSLYRCDKITDQGLEHVIRGCKHLHKLNLTCANESLGQAVTSFPLHWHNCSCWTCKWFAG